MGEGSRIGVSVSVSEASVPTSAVEAIAASQPVVVGDCFGWLHHPAPGRVGDVAVLLCPALGWDALHSYHGTGLLADRLAAAGFPALRFQYPGTGDSADLAAPSAEPDHWAAWLHSVHAAADWLRETTGARRLVFAGLRFGALPATVAAQERDDVEALLLVAPVLRGKSYLRQLDMEARLETGAAPDADGCLEFHELRLPRATVQQISAIDLRRAALPSGMRVALFPQAHSNLVDECATAWTASGATVEVGSFDGLEPLLQEAIHTDLPVPDFTRLLASSALGARVPIRHASPKRPAEPRLDLPDCIETPIRFGAGGRLFGILCSPRHPHGRRAVVIGNTGRDPHFGIARFAVELARHLAGEGIASLRLDFAGLGDSRQAGTSEPLSSLFNADRTADISAAIDLLEARGFREFAVHGLCSGAYHGFRAALAEPRISALLLVNLPTFDWQGGDTVKSAIWKSAPPSRMLLRLADPAMWRRAISGGVDARSFLHGVGRRLLDAVRHAAASATGPGSRADTPKAMVATLSARRVATLLLYSAGDPGLDALVLAFGQGGMTLRGFPGIDLRIVSELDHILSGRPMRERAAAEMVGFLAAHWPSALPVDRSTKHDDPFDHPRPDCHRRAAAEADAVAVAG